jgi:hypothetical protein
MRTIKGGDIGPIKRVVIAEPCVPSESPIQEPAYTPSTPAPVEPAKEPAEVPA